MVEGAVCASRRLGELQYLLPPLIAFGDLSPLYEEGGAFPCGGLIVSTHKNGALLSQSAALLFNSVEREN